MADSPKLPGPQSWMDASGKPLPVDFYRFLRDLLKTVAQSSGNASDLASVLARIAALEAEAGGDGSITTPYSVASFGNLADGLLLQLVNDAAAPGNTTYYGTGPTGAKGYSPIADALAEGSNITLTVGSDGVTTIAASGGEQTYQRIDAAGDIRIAADGSLRVTI